MWARLGFDLSRPCRLLAISRHLSCAFTQPISSLPISKVAPTRPRATRLVAEWILVELGVIDNHQYQGGGEGTAARCPLRCCVFAALWPLGHVPAHGCWPRERPTAPPARPAPPPTSAGRFAYHGAPLRHVAGKKSDYEERPGGYGKPPGKFVDGNHVTHHPDNQFVNI